MNSIESTIWRVVRHEWTDHSYQLYDGELILQLYSIKEREFSYMLNWRGCNRVMRGRLPLIKKSVSELYNTIKQIYFRIRRDEQYMNALGFTLSAPSIPSRRISSGIRRLLDPSLIGELAAMFRYTFGRYRIEVLIGTTHYSLITVKLYDTDTDASSYICNFPQLHTCRQAMNDFFVSGEFIVSIGHDVWSEIQLNMPATMREVLIKGDVL